MIFEFLIACRMTGETDIGNLLTQLLADAIDYNSQDEFEENEINAMVRITHERTSAKADDDSAQTDQRSLIGFNLELPEMSSVEATVNHFANSLLDSGPIFHAVKFEDPLLKDELAERSVEIFRLEMKLRRVLSFIYLHA